MNAAKVAWRRPVCSGGAASVGGAVWPMAVDRDGWFIASARSCCASSASLPRRCWTPDPDAAATVSRAALSSRGSGRCRARGSGDVTALSSGSRNLDRRVGARAGPGHGRIPYQRRCHGSSPWPAGRNRADVQCWPDTQGDLIGPRLSDGLPCAFCRATCSRVSALNGPLDAAIELPGRYRLRAPSRLYCSTR
jgi:hypothetical protein